MFGGWIFVGVVVELWCWGLGFFPGVVKEDSSGAEDTFFSGDVLPLKGGIWGRWRRVGEEDLGAEGAFFGGFLVLPLREGVWGSWECVGKGDSREVFFEEALTLPLEGGLGGIVWGWLGLGKEEGAECLGGVEGGGFSLVGFWGGGRGVECWDLTWASSDLSVAMVAEAFLKDS
jgi:hypothetical protein